MTAELIEGLVQAALAADLADPERRSLLLFGYPTAVRGALPAKIRPTDQVRSDLQTLSGQVIGGEAGHLRWLRNALHLAGFLPEVAEVFRSALAGRAETLDAAEAQALDAAADVIRQKRIAGGATGVVLAAGERRSVVVEQEEVTGAGTVGVRVEALGGPVSMRVQQHVAAGGIGVQNTFGPKPPPLASLLDTGTLDAPPITPAQHLVARYQVVDFLGRSLLDDLHAWADSAQPVAVRLIHGPGGAGKTRLALEWLKKRAADKGFIKGTLDDTRIAVLADAPEADLVLDYAESRLELLALLRALAERWQQRRPGRLRLLLLARGAGDWWEGLKGADALVGALLADPAQSIALPLVPEAERADHFTHAAACFQRTRGWPAPPAVPDLKDPRFGRPLYLHFAAFLAGEGLQTSADTVLDDFLDHEARFWLKRAGHAGQETTDAARALRHATEQAVGALTLRNGARDADHLDAVLAGLALKKKERKPIKDLLADLYATPTHLAGPLEPDLLGEALVLRLLRAAKHHPRWLDQAVAGADEAELTHTFTVLGRAEALDPREEAIVPAERHLLRDPDRALPAFYALVALSEVTAHARLGQVLAEALEARGTAELAAVLEPHLVKRFKQTVQLREVAAWVDATLSARHTGSEARARQLNNLGNRLSALGRREEALAAAAEAVELRRTLAAARPGAFTPDLAGNLANLGNRLSALGRREEALAATAEAVERYRTLAAARPDAFTPDLAGSLTNLGAMLSGLGRREEALAAAAEAVERYRTLAAARPDAFTPDLATSLNNLGMMLSALGRREEALAATAEAVERYRTLATARPDAFTPNLAMSLNNLGAMLSALGRREEALAATAEAVERYRTLAAARPDAFTPDLARSLGVLGHVLAAAGRTAEAQAAFLEGVEQVWPLFERHPAAFAQLMGALLRDALARLDGPPPPTLMARLQRFQTLTP